ncbi:MAG: hypothetical protein ACI9SK_000604 [Zhongshania sp.]
MIITAGVGMYKALQNLRWSLKSDWFFYGCVLLYISGAWLITHYYELGDRFSILIYVNLALFQFIPYGMLFYAAYIVLVMIKIRPKRLFSYLYNDFWDWLKRPTTARGCLGLLVLCIFLSAMTSLKAVIPDINSFSWDPLLADIDNTVHGGFAPWEIIHPLVSWSVITRIIDIVYGLWFIVMMTFVVWFLFSSNNDVLRKRFMSAYILCWIINGSVLAVFFSSVGPAFYSQSYPELINPFHSLMSYLHNTNIEYPILALQAQEELWTLYQNSTLSPAAGISSMPSMHVSVATLILIISWRTKLVIPRVCSSVFFIMILIGSVHLAWHYAVDGYLSIIVTALVWRCSHYLTRKMSLQTL